MGFESSPVCGSVARGQAPAGSRARQLTAWVRPLLFDRRGNASRPRLLFAIAAADVLSVVSAWPLSNALIGSQWAPSWPRAAGAVILATLTTAILHSQWSYSIPSLRRLTPQILKVLTSVVAVAVIVAGLAYMLDQRLASPAQISVWMAMSAILLCSTR